MSSGAPPCTDMGVVYRVNHLDSAHVDADLHSLFLSQCVSILKYLSPSVSLHYRPELCALLSALCFYLSVGAKRSTPGARLHNLTYTYSSPSLNKRQRVFLFVFSVLLPYAQQRLAAFLVTEGFGGYPRGTWRRVVYDWYHRLDSVWSVLSLLHFSAFLRTGRYPLVADRVLGLHYEPINPRAPRQISLEYTNQIIAWTETSRMAVFCINALQWRKIAGALCTPIYAVSSALSKAAHTLYFQNNPHNSSHHTALHSSIQRTIGVTRHTSPCPFCLTASSSVCNPYLAACGCVCCYYCIAKHTLQYEHTYSSSTASAVSGVDASESGAAVICPRCTVGIHNIRPFVLRLI